MRRSSVVFIEPFRWLSTNLTTTKNREVVGAALDTS